MKFRENSAAVRKQVKALEILEGFPKRAEHIGAEFVRLGLVPASYSPGAVGWTDKLCDLLDVGGGQLECEIPDDVVNRHEGKETTVDGERVKVAVRGKEAQAAPKAR